MAAVFSLLVLALAALRGSTAYPQYGGMTTWSIIATYFAVGLPAGAMAGALRPLLRWRAGAALVGYLVAAVVYGGAGLGMGYAPGRVLLVAALCGLGGAVAGLMWWPDGPGGGRGVGAPPT
jgi:hypothetical protein